MSGFSAEWLALREPVDHRSRSRRVTQSVVNALSSDRPLRVVDLAAGTGSNARFLAPLLPTPQDWLLVDQDAQLLGRARALMGPISTRVVDLSQLNELRSMFAGDAVKGAPLLVTASALLDLVSNEWLQTMGTICHDHHAAVLFALSYDGRITCSPAEPEDELIRTLVNQHQHRDKGFGPALGPEAALEAAEHFGTLGYEVVTDRSDWVVERDSGALQQQLIDGWASAAAEILPGRTSVIRDWQRRRTEHVGHNRSRLIVGHEDLAAFMA